MIANPFIMSIEMKEINRGSNCKKCSVNKQEVTQEVRGRQIGRMKGLLLLSRLAFISCVTPKVNIDTLLLTLVS